MIHRVSHGKFSRDTNARKALLKNLANDLILRERVRTTEAKAKAIRPFVEKLITKSKDNTIASRRLLISKLGRENSVQKLLELVGPTFKDRSGGYTRIVKLVPRTGDKAEMAMIEFSENVSEKAAMLKLAKKPKTKEAKTAKGDKETKLDKVKPIKTEKLAKSIKAKKRPKTKVRKTNTRTAK